MHTPRPVRVTTPPIEIRLATEFGCLLNISATGALLRVSAEMPVGRECPLILNMPAGPVPLKVRVMRAKSSSAALAAGTDQALEYLVGVHFTEVSSTAKHTIAELCGEAFLKRE